MEDDTSSTSEHPGQSSLDLLQLGQFKNWQQLSYYASPLRRDVQSVRPHDDSSEDFRPRPGDIVGGEVEGCEYSLGGLFRHKRGEVLESA